MHQRPLVELHVAGPALSAFLQVIKTWGLTTSQSARLVDTGDPPLDPQSRLSLDQVERISHVLRIFRLLGAMRVDQRAWLDTPRDEPVFGGRTPLTLMSIADPRGLAQVAGFLEELSGENQ